jgi:hypothetical protein
VPMDVEDQRYFTQQFGLVHKRITESERSQTGELHRVTEDQNKKIAQLQQSIETHKVESATHNGTAVNAAAAAAKLAVDEHEDDSWVHNPVKTWKLLGAIAAFFGLLGAGVMWLIKHFKP